MDMLQSIQPLLDWISAHPQWAGLVVFLVAASESLVVVGILVPGVVLMTGVGALIGLGTLDFWSCMFWATMGAIVGDGVSYWLGVHFHRQIQSLWPMSRYPELVPKGEAFFKKHGGKSVFFGRFIGPIRAIIPTIAGIMEMPPARFYLVNVLSAILWAPVVLVPGVVLGASLTVASQASTRLVIVLILLAATVWLLYLFIKGFINRLSLYGRLTRLQISSLLMAVFIMIAGVSVFNVYKTLNTAEQLVFSQSTKAGDWWADDWSMLPAYRSGALNYASSPMSIQWAGKLGRIEDLLIRQGWARPEPLTYTSMMLWLTPDTNLQKIPLAPVYHNWHAPALRLVKMTASQDKMFVVQLWPVNVNAAGLEDGLWLGYVSTVSLNTQFNLLFYPRPGPGNNFSSALTSLREMLLQEQTDKQINFRLVKREPDSEALEKWGGSWDGDVLLLAEPGLFVR
jgi:membrane protein DedA with SNARE-associated domain